MTVDVVLEFAPLVKSLKAGKLPERGKSAALSLKMVDSDMKRELFYISGAIVPICKLLTDPKAVAQAKAGVQALRNLMRVAMWDECQIALESMGKPLVSLVTKGGLAKKMIGIDLLLRVCLFQPIERSLTAAGIIEGCCALPKGIIPLALPKWTAKGWKAGKRQTGLETKAARLLGSLARMSDTTRKMINNGINAGVMLLIRMLLGKQELAGELNETQPDSSAIALQSLQWCAIDAGSRVTMIGADVIPTICKLLDPPPDKDTPSVDLEQIDRSFRKADFRSALHFYIRCCNQFCVASDCRVLM